MTVKERKTVKKENEFWDIVHEIREVAEERMTVKERKKFQNVKSVLLGGKAAKNPKIPYNILQGIKRKEKETKKKLKEDERHSGVPHYELKPPSKKKEPERLKQLKSTKGVGKFKNGSLYISKKALGL
mmetsp:Transcript_11217/g.22069  ORF Transcript_11217/g.22069 Transcript_11217/m.22069 type:complete len:128 (-) Transcript_11217:2342-2725(-)